MCIYHRLVVTVNDVCLVVWRRNAEIEMEADRASDTQLFRYIRTVHCIERRRCAPCQATRLHSLQTDSTSVQIRWPKTVHGQCLSESDEGFTMWLLVLDCFSAGFWFVMLEVDVGGHFILLLLSCEDLLFVMWHYKLYMDCLDMSQYSLLVFHHCTQHAFNSIQFISGNTAHKNTQKIHRRRQRYTKTHKDTQKHRKIQ